jgi:mono/diheme cytochrome c family protein
VKILIPALGVLALVAGVSLSTVASAKVEAQGARTVWDSVYTPAQATRGEKLYATHCTRCHGDNALGSEGPALTGPLFAANWEGVTLNDLHTRIQQTMPADNPGVMSRQDAADVIAYLLRLGKMPEGTTELSGDAGTLMQIKFVSNKPS